MNTFTGIFKHHCKPPMLSPCIDWSPPSNFEDYPPCSQHLWETLHSRLCSDCDQASDLWQQPELASELDSDLRGTADWGRKWLVDFNAGESQLVSFDRSNNTGAIEVKMDGPVLQTKSCWFEFFFKTALGLLCSLYL